MHLSDYLGCMKGEFSPEAQAKIIRGGGNGEVKLMILNFSKMVKEDVDGFFFF